MNKILTVMGAMVFAAGCVDLPAELTSTQAATGPATVTTDAAAYNFGNPVTVQWDGLNGNATDWITIAPQGSNLTVNLKWIYTGGATSGSVSLEGPVPGGLFVARAFDNDSYTLMGESDAFDVADPSDTIATIAVDRTEYDITTPIVATWTGMPPNPDDWIAIAPVGAPDTTEAVWKYTTGTVDGNLTFSRGLSLASMVGFPGGWYEARLYLNDQYARVAQTQPFLVGALMTTDQTSYTTNQAITVDWTHLPGNSDDWIGLAPAGSPSNSVIVWLYTNGGVNGSRTFNAGLTAPGTYVARAFAPDTYFAAGESAPFTVVQGAMATITTDQSSYALGDNVTVSWTNMPGNNSDWISVAPELSSDQTTTRWIYTGGQVNGTTTFQGPPTTGSYVARGYLNDTYVRVGESTPFPVN